MSQEKLRLRLYKHPTSGIWQIRGTYLGVVVDESASTRNERDAEGVLERRKRDIYEEVILNKPKDRSFAEAAIGYMKADGEKRFLAKILAAEFRINGKKRIFGELLLREIDQGVIDDLAAYLYPDAMPSTRNRQLYTPVSAVLAYAGEQRSWGYSHGRIRRPESPPGRVDWRTPQEMEWWLKRCGPERAIITGYLGTGARASELVKLDWADVSPALHSLTLWEKDTKAGKARSIELQRRVRGVLPDRPLDGRGRVYLNSRGEHWTVLAIEKALDRITVREARKAATDAEREQISELVHMSTGRKFSDEQHSQSRKDVWALYETIAARENIPWIHPHVLRHTWATWGYAVTRDLAWLMSRGGWAKPDMAMRYTHVGTPDLAEDVLAHGWEMRADLAPRLPALPRPAESA